MGTATMGAARSARALALKKNYSNFPVDPGWGKGNKGDLSEWLPMLDVRIALAHGKPSPKIAAIVDTGSPWCLFRADLARSFLDNLDVKNGFPYDIGGVIAGVKQVAYFHKIRLYVETNWIIDVKAGFLEDLSVAGLLGRRGFFENFVVRFDHTTTPPFFEIEKIPAIN